MKSKIAKSAKNRVSDSAFNFYSHYMQTVPLLNREQELLLAKKIEAHLNETLFLIAKFPDSLDIIQSHFTEIRNDELKLNTLIYGFVLEKNSACNRDPKPTLQETEKKLFDLSMLQGLVKRRILHFGIEDQRTLESQKELSVYLATFKWNPDILKKLVHTIQSLSNDSDTVETQSLKVQLCHAFEEFKAAKQRLIESNLRLVFLIAKKYICHGLLFSDLIQEGNIGLIQAADRFEYRFGYSFANYAIWWIRHNILSFISKHRAIIQNSENCLEDEHTLSLVESVSAQNLSEITHKALSSLSMREAEILRMRFGISMDSEHTLEEISQLFKITKRRVSQIEAKALKALSQQWNADQLKRLLDGPF